MDLTDQLNGILPSWSRAGASGGTADAEEHEHGCMSARFNVLTLLFVRPPPSSHNVPLPGCPETLPSALRSALEERLASERRRADEAEEKLALARKALAAAMLGWAVWLAAGRRIWCNIFLL